MDKTTAAAVEILASLGLHDSQKREAWDAYLEHPTGTVRLASNCLNDEAEGRGSAAAFFLAGIRRNEHARMIEERARITGWRAVYGAGHAAMSYVEDPKGTDPLPPGYDLNVYAHPVSPWNQEGYED